MFGLFKKAKLAEKLSEELSWQLAMAMQFHPEDLQYWEKEWGILAEAYNTGLPVNAAVVRELEHKGKL